MKDRIKKDMFTAMKTKDVVTRDILRVLTGEIQRNEQTTKGKVDLTDADILKIIKKMIETAETPEDKVVLEGYMPTQMNSDDMIEEVASFIAREKLDSPKEMGKVMGYFKQNFDGTYDGKELSRVVKGLLT